ncbi:MAG: ATP-dependent DNA helicase DinG, partial [Gammaproteobacteria bacterium]|nr:ATP-dependent DNA helicase DinG [Gammaproteobacteria bacterium]
KDQFNIQLQDTQPKAHLIEQHKLTIDQGKGSVLIGLDSFGEGLNLPGNYCTHVVICKLPFPVPSSPVEEAQAEYIESQGKRPFDELAVPFTSAKLTQWVGRLLRTESDTGRVSILDNRLLTKYYGRKMLAALPGFKI